MEIWTSFSNLLNKPLKVSPEIIIREGKINEIFEVHCRIPEFDDRYGLDEFKKRLEGKKKLILLAESNGKLLGYKAGYCEKHYFYSWMGGVIPEYRKQDIATMLAHKQEDWVKKQGLDTIRFKTLNKFKKMLLFSISNGFRIIGTVPYEGEEGFKILLEKRFALELDEG